MGTNSRKTRTLTLLTRVIVTEVPKDQEDTRIQDREEVTQDTQDTPVTLATQDTQASKDTATLDKEDTQMMTVDIPVTRLVDVIKLHHQVQKYNLPWPCWPPVKFVPSAGEKF